MAKSEFPCSRASGVNAGEKGVRFLGFKKRVTTFQNNFALKPNVLTPWRATFATSRVYTSDETGSLTTEYFKKARKCTRLKSFQPGRADVGH